MTYVCQIHVVQTLVQDNCVLAYFLSQPTGESGVLKSPTTHAFSPIPVFRVNDTCLIYFGVTSFGEYILMSPIFLVYYCSLDHQCSFLYHHSFQLEGYFISCLSLPSFECHLLVELFFQYLLPSLSLLLRWVSWRQQVGFCFLIQHAILHCFMDELSLLTFSD